MSTRKILMWPAETGLELIPFLRGQLLGALQQGDVLLDLKALTHMPTAGVAVLLEAHQQSLDSGYRFVVGGINPSVHATLAMLHLDKIFYVDSLQVLCVP